MLWQMVDLHIQRYKYKMKLQSNVHINRDLSSLYVGILAILERVNEIHMSERNKHLDKHAIFYRN